MLSALRFYEQGILQNVTGDSLHPGGLDLTARGLARLELKPGARILDVACGEGATLRHAGEQGWTSTVGVDLSLEMLRLCRSRAPAWLVRARGDSLPFKRESMDAVLCECSLALFDDAVSALDGFWRLLKAGGRLMLSDLYARNDEGGAALFTRRALESRLSKMGFANIAWEDHTRALHTLVAQLVFRYGSLSAFFEKSGAVAGNFCAGIDVGCSIRDAKPGYFLLVAEKPAEGNGKG